MTSPKIADIVIVLETSQNKTQKKPKTVPKSVTTKEETMTKSENKGTGEEEYHTDIENSYDYKQAGELFRE